jgi:CRISPR/Cas system CSM-associated protein Csm4 (group 5 of RAMP superfamily)
MEAQSREPALLVRLRPTGPWRIGGETGQPDDVSPIFPSDRLFSALTHAFARLGELNAWLESTVNADRPAVRLTSLFPFFGKQHYVPPPVTVWPPATASARMNWHAARLVPVSVIEDLLGGEGMREDRWEVDGLSGCLLPAGAQSPFRKRLRATAPVDRLNGSSSEAYLSGCIEFNQGAGLWGTAIFTDTAAQQRWEGPLRSAFALLADTGLGGERSRGWGQAESPDFQRGEWPGLLIAAALPAADGPQGFWLLGAYVPAPIDSIDWQSGHYELRLRHGRVESAAGWGAAKKTLNMVREGSVLVATAPPQGQAVDVAPAGFAHPVWRSGFAAAVPVPWKPASYQLPQLPTRNEPVRPREETPAPLADIYLLDPVIVEEANIVEEAQIVEQPRYVDEETE